MKCPGQDRGFWTGDRVFELPCPRCGSTVEFFRDENARRCSQCGYRFNNPRVALDCASWCDQAESCLGISRSSGVAPGQTDTALAGRLIQALEDEFPKDSSRFARALLVFQHAKELVSAVGVDPRTILAAALLLEVDEGNAVDPLQPARQSPGAVESQSKVRRILSGAGLDEDTICRVRSLLAAYRDRPKSDTIELAILRDARRLAGLAEEGGAGNPERLESIMADDFQTEAGQARARSLFQRTPGRLE